MYFQQLVNYTIHETNDNYKQPPLAQIGKMSNIFIVQYNINHYYTPIFNRVEGK